METTVGDEGSPTPLRGPTPEGLTTETQLYWTRVDSRGRTSDLTPYPKEHDDLPTY